MIQWIKREHPDAMLDLADLQYGLDMADPNTAAERCRGKDLIIHFGNLSHVEKSIPPGAGRRFLQNNLMSTWNLLESCCANRAKMIYISSSEVYGSAQERFLNDQGQMPEEHPLCPHSPYAASKVAADRTCYAHWKTYGTDVRVVRPFNQFGPYQASEKLIPKIIETQLGGEPFPAEDGGTQSRDYLFVQDTARGIWAAQDLPAGEVVNICYGEDFTVQWFAEKIHGILLQIGKVDGKVPAWVSKGHRPGQVQRLCGANQKAADKLGWHPVHSIEDAIEKTVHWFLGSGPIRPPDEGSIFLQTAGRT